jgi:DNA polymerase-3 subunit alpha
VAWALTITDLDPLRFGLLFERFLNPERVSMPDFDIDFCQDRRDEVIRYVQQKYGHDHVAQIITFGKLQARAVLRDVGRVLQMPYGQVDRLCKLVPNNPASPVTLKEAIDGEPRLQEAQRDDETVDRMLNIGLKLEGLYRHASTHAAGVVIGDRPLDELVPLYRDPRSDMPVTQFSMKWVEPAGLVKFDFLGLKTLTVLQKAAQLLAKRGIKIDLSKIPLDDEATYEMLSRGDATGVFQLESSGMRDTLRRLKPDCIEDIIALVALYRPGPMDNIPLYTDRKAGKQEPDFLHPLLEPILKETHGVIIYQEQVMQIAQVLSGYSLGEADLLRRAMGKKIKSEMDKQKERFVSGAVDNGVKTEKAAFIFELVEKFAGYGFNKSHAAAYAIVAYQTAFLKANHPVEFLAASMTLDLGNTDKLNVFRQEALRVGIPVELPNVNRSGPRFGAEDGKIQYALGALKNVGRLAMEGLANERIENGPFVSLADFASRIDSKMINKRALESLIKAGALDGLHTNRAQLMGAIEAILGAANRAADDRQSNQQNLFGEAVAADDIQMPDIDEWLPTDRLAHEFEAAGFYLSGHPLDDYQSALRQCRVMTIADLHKQGAATAKVNLAGMVLRKQERKSKSGNSFAFVELSDPTGRFEGVIFSDLLNSHRQLFEPGTAVVVGVEAEKEGDDIKLRFQSVRAIDDVTSKAASGLRVFAQDKQAIEGVKRRLPAAGRGVVTFVMMVEDGLKEVELELPGGFAINPKVRGAIKSVPGVLEVEDL